MPIRVLAWSEGTAPATLYPHGIHGAVADALREGEAFEVQTATIDHPDQGLGTLDSTDVLVWWGHGRHEEVEDRHAAAIARHVRDRGMGLLVLHSGHHSKPFRTTLECSGNLGGWREAAERERLWIVDPLHPIARGLANPINIPHEEMYAEPFDVPSPDELVFISWFAGGEVFRSGCAWHRGRGRVFYFRPGHESYPTLHLPTVRHILRNAALWCAAHHASHSTSSHSVG